MNELILIIQGIIIGLFAADLTWRKRLRSDLELKEAELKIATKTLSDLHNSAMAANQDLQNKVQSLEQAYRAQSQVAAVKRF